MKTLHLFIFLFCLSASALAQQTSEINCRIWVTDSLCKFPEGINIPAQYYCEDCTWEFKSCESLDKKHYTAVWITFKKEIDTTFILETNFKNISLTSKTKGKIIHPSAILWYRDNEGSPALLNYMSSAFKAKKYLVSIKPKVNTDLILVFSKAEVGDKITIENYIDAEIQNP